MNDDTAREVGQALRKLGDLHAETARTLQRLADLFGAAPEAVTPAAEPPATAAPPPVFVPATFAPAEDAPARARQPLDWNWVGIEEAAIRLLDADPARPWAPAELCRAVRDSGVDVPTLKGMHFGLMARLRERNAIEELEDGRFRAAASVPAAAPPAAPPPAAAPAPEPVAERGAGAWDWGRIADTAVGLLSGNPARIWRQAELCSAIRDSGVDIPTLKDMPVELTDRLREQDAIVEDGKGGFRYAVPGAPRPESTPPPAPARAPEAELLPRRSIFPDPVRDLAEEIDRMRPYLGDFSRRQRSAQVCAWAGRARALQDRPANGTGAVDTGALRSVFGRLTRITQEMDCAWVDALSREWSTDWNVYVARYEAVLGKPAPELTPDQQREYHRSILRGLFNTRRHGRSRDAEIAIAEALPVLSEDDPVLKEAVGIFGRPASARPAAAPPPPRREKEEDAEAEAPTREDIPPEVLAITRGRRALMVGGQGAREQHREAVARALELADLKWETSERSQASVFTRLAETIRPGRYDLVIYLAGFASHKSGSFVRACKDASIPFVYIPRGYSVSSIVYAIREQLVERRPAAVGAEE